MEKLYKKTRALLKKWGVTDDEADEFMKELMDTADKDKDGDVSDDVAEAKEEIAEEGKDEQSDKDRVDESVGEKLKDGGKDPNSIGLKKTALRFFSLFFHQIFYFTTQRFGEGIDRFYARLIDVFAALFVHLNGA